jgi:hypothetical protein
MHQHQRAPLVAVNSRSRAAGLHIRRLCPAKPALLAALCAHAFGNGHIRLGHGVTTPRDRNPLAVLSARAGLHDLRVRRRLSCLRSEILFAPDAKELLQQSGVARISAVLRENYV